MSLVADPLKQILSPLKMAQLHNNNSAILIVDMQYLDAHPEYGLIQIAKQHGIDTKYYEDRLKVAIKNIQLLLKACRENGLEVIYCTIESMTKDGRDRSKEHKKANLHASPNSKEGEVIEELRPMHDEMVFKKTCSGVFNGSNIDQKLRNLKIDNLIITGVLTNQCVDTAVRDAADRGYDVVLVTDACAAFHESLHQASLEILEGIYCCVESTKKVVDHIYQINR